MLDIPSNSLSNNNGHIENFSNTVFLNLLRNTYSSNIEKYKKLSRSIFIHGLARYPNWTPTTDIFRFIRPQYFKRLCGGKAFFIFDYSTEGFSPVKEFPFFDMLYFNCKKYNVSPSKIIYVSANHRDNDNLAQYCKENSVDPINVFTFPAFESVVTNDDARGKVNAEKEFFKVKSDCTEHHTTKMASSLSRLWRPHRALASFMLWHSEIKDRMLISQNIVPAENPAKWRENFGLTDYTDKQVMDWREKLPLVVDRTDFNNNWATSEFPYSHIHAQTIFQIVNETQADDRDKTSMFYSEKTFRPIGYFQPFVIFGQPGCNHYLKELGYKLYDEWFDLSFDFEEDTTMRYRKLLKEVIRVTNELSAMSKSERIDWRFKNKELLIHNFNVMTASALSKNSLYNFLLTLQQK